MRDVVYWFLLRKPLVWMGIGILSVVVLIGAISNAIFGEEETFSNM